MEDMEQEEAQAEDIVVILVVMVEEVFVLFLTMDIKSHKSHYINFYIV